MRFTQRNEMNIGSLGSQLRRWGGTAWLAVLALPVAGCETALLEYSDPDIIVNAESASGALALKNGVIQRLNGATSGGEGLWFMGGLVTDEWRSGDTFEQRNTTDQRSILNSNSFLGGQLLALNRVRIQGEQAVGALRKYSPTPTSNIGLMFAVTAYAVNLEGEHYCNGVPFGEFIDGVAWMAPPSRWTPPSSGLSPQVIRRSSISTARRVPRSGTSPMWFAVGSCSTWAGTPRPRPPWRAWRRPSSTK